MTARPNVKEKAEGGPAVILPETIRAGPSPSTAAAGLSPLDLSRNGRLTGPTTPCSDSPSSRPIEGQPVPPLAEVLLCPNKKPKRRGGRPPQNSGAGPDVPFQTPAPAERRKHLLKTTAYRRAASCIGKRNPREV